MIFERRMTHPDQKQKKSEAGLRYKYAIDPVQENND